MFKSFEQVKIDENGWKNLLNIFNIVLLFICKRAFIQVRTVLFSRLKSKKHKNSDTFGMC